MTASTLPQTTTDQQKGFLATLAEQRWDDHRYYHQSRINQSLHLLSGCMFLVTYYFLLTKDPIRAAFLGWVGAMVSRQTGHFVFEPTGYDELNGASNATKEEIKVGFNFTRKVLILVAWALTPVVLYFVPSFFGLFAPWNDQHSYFYNLSVLWIGLGIFGLLARTAWLCATRRAIDGLAWCTKILTDPFHDIYLYHKSPLYLLKGELIDPMYHVRSHQQAPGQ